MTNKQILHTQRKPKVAKVDTKKPIVAKVDTKKPKVAKVDTKKPKVAKAAKADTKSHKSGGGHYDSGISENSIKYKAFKKHVMSTLSRALRSAKSIMSRSRIYPLQKPRQKRVIERLPSDTSLKERIRKYNLINVYLRKIDSLKNIKSLYNNEALVSRYTDYTIYTNIIRTDNSNFEEYNIVSKVMIEDKQLETKLMKIITEDIILKGLSKHFIIMYYYHYHYFNKIKSIVNNNEATDGNISLLMIKRKLTYKHRGDIDSILLLKAVNEEDIKIYKEMLAIDTFIQTRLILDSESFQNILIQSLLSIGSFHNLTGYIHRDCNYENFLIQKNNVDLDGYYMYTINDYNYYLKSCKYNVMLFNFGLSKDMLMSNEDLDEEFNQEKNHVKILNLEDNIIGEDDGDKYIKMYIYLLLADYRRLFLNIYDNQNIENTIGYINFKRKIREKYNDEIFSQKLDNLFNIIYEKYDKEKLNDYQSRYKLSNLLLFEIINLCITFFPDIFLIEEEFLQLKSNSTIFILNENEPFQLYLADKKGVNDLPT